MLRKLTSAFAFLLTLTASIVGAQAQCASYPYTLTNGTTADASQVMANFNCAVLSGGSYSGVTFNSATFAGTTTIPGGVINSSGQIGIGTTTLGSAGLTVYGNSPSVNITQNPGIPGAASLSLSAAGGAGNYPTVTLHSFSIFGSTTATVGYIGSNSHTAWVEFQSSGTTFYGSGGTCTINGAGSCTSDARLKRNIHEIAGSNALTRLSKIKGVTYNWADPALEQKQNVGVLAQSVLQAYPQLVGTTETKFRGKKGRYYTVNYAGLTAPLISAVNELNRRVGALQASVREMKREKVLDTVSAPSGKSKPDMAQLIGLIESLQTANERQAAEIRALKNEIGDVRRSVRLQTALNASAGPR